MILLEDVYKTYGGKPAVDGIRLEVPEGSVFGLIGPNGAGKTTTLKMVGTLVKPDRGRVVVAGNDLAVSPRTARKILGYMPDLFGHFRGLSCLEYLEFFGRAHDLRGAELAGRVEAVLELTDLRGKRDELTSALSTGMRQRLCLAKTLLHDPRVLVLDEPASGLDPRARIEIRSLLQELGRMGKTVLISSHILSDLEEICTHAAILEAGRVVWGGSIQAIKKELRSRRSGFTVEVPEEELARALELVRAVPAVEDVRAPGPPGARITGRTAGRQANQVLQALVSAGIEVVSFSQEKVDLEAIFLERTKGIVS